MEEIMKKNNVLGGIFALIAGIIGVIGHFVLFFQWYVAGMSAESAEPGCEILLKYIHPGLGDLGLVASALFLVSAYGFFTKKNWAYVMSIAGIILALLASFFINIPFMAAGLPPVYFFLFIPYLLFYFVFLWKVGELPWSNILFGMLAGVTYIFCFMNGVSSTSRIITVGDPIFTLVVVLHWVAMFGWAIVAFGILTKPKKWMIPVGLTAGVIELIVGIPLGYITTVELGRFSLFSLAPISSLAMVIILLIPNLWEKWTHSAE
jgi:hypothetical protein